MAKAVEARLAVQQEPPRRVEIEDALASGQIRRFDPLPAYEAHVRRLVDFDVIRRGGLRVAVDAMYGAGRIHLRRLLQDAGCDVTELRSEMNPGFNGIHPEPIARHLGPLIDAMRSGAYRLGLATDGDADRIGAVDPGGRFIDPHGIMALLLDYLVNDRGLRGSVVKTVSTTQILNRLALRYDLPLHETPVGFNYISDWMLREQVLLGGEESGGISMLGHIPEGDGVLMALLLAEMVAARQKTLSQMLDELMDAPDIGRFHYARLDQPVRPFAKAELVEALLATACGHRRHACPRSERRDGVKYILQDGSWLLIRAAQAGIAHLCRGAATPRCRAVGAAADGSDAYQRANCSIMTSHEQEETIVDQFIKLAGVVRTGGEAKRPIQSGLVLVTPGRRDAGVSCTRAMW